MKPPTPQELKELKRLEQLNQNIQRNKELARIHLLALKTLLAQWPTK